MLFLEIISVTRLPVYCLVLENHMCLLSSLEAPENWGLHCAKWFILSPQLLGLCIILICMYINISVCLSVYMSIHLSSYSNKFLRIRILLWTGVELSLQFCGQPFIQYTTLCNSQYHGINWAHTYHTCQYFMASLHLHTAAKKFAKPYQKKNACSYVKENG